MTEKKILTLREDEFLAAADAGDARKLSELLAAGVDVNVTNDENFGALHSVAWLDHIDALKVLLKHKPKLDVHTVTGLTPLTLTAMHKHEQAGILLLEAGAGANVPHSNGSPALDDAAQLGLADLAKALVKYGAHIEAHKPGAKSPAILAVMGGSFGIFKMLEEKGADIHYADKDGFTSLRASVWQNDIFNYLLPKTPDAELQKQGMALVMDAAFADNANAIRKLAARGVKVAEAGNGKLTPLHAAAIYDRPVAAGALLEQGMPLDTLDFNKLTARQEAVRKGHNAVIDRIDARQLKLDVDDIVSTVKQGVGIDAEAPAPARFVRKKSPGQ